MLASKTLPRIPNFAEPAICQNSIFAEARCANRVWFDVFEDTKQPIARTTTFRHRYSSRKLTMQPGWLFCCSAPRSALRRLADESSNPANAISTNLGMKSQATKPISISPEARLASKSHQFCIHESFIFHSTIARTRLWQNTEPPPHTHEPQ